MIADSYAVGVKGSEVVGHGFGFNFHDGSEIAPDGGVLVGLEGAVGDVEGGRGEGSVIENVAVDVLWVSG